MKHRPSAAAVLATAWLAVALAAPPVSASPFDTAAVWLADQQASNGAFGSKNAPADLTAEALVALLSSGAPADTIDLALTHLAEHGPARAAAQPAFAGRIAMALRAVGENPRAFEGTDYVALAVAEYDEITGAYDTKGLYANALAGLGAAAGGKRIPEAAITYLRTNECPAGGFGHSRGCLNEADTDTTAMTLMLLRAAGVARGDELITRAFDYLSTAEADGGYALNAGGPANANSTGLVLSMRAGWGMAPGAARAALERLQHASGGFRYLAVTDEPNLYATIQALPGLAGVGFPPTVIERASDATPARDTRGTTMTSPSDAVAERATPTREKRSSPGTRSTDPARTDSIAAGSESASTEDGSRAPVIALALAVAAVTSGGFLARRRLT